MVLITNKRSGRGLSWTQSLQTCQKCTENGEEQHDHLHSTLSVKHLVIWKENIYLYICLVYLLPGPHWNMLLLSLSIFLDRHVLIDLSWSIWMETKLSSYLSAKSRDISPWWMKAQDRMLKRWRSIHQSRLQCIFSRRLMISTGQAAVSRLC